MGQYCACRYLEPIYELKLSLGTLATAAEQRDRWPALKKRLDKFFSGGPISERNYYAGVALQYVEQIRYDDLDEFVKQDKRERRSAMEETHAHPNQARTCDARSRRTACC